jgi:hypothetical protein
MRSAFLSGYRAVRALPPDLSLRWHTAAALVAERGVRAVNTGCTCPPSTGSRSSWRPRTTCW